MPHSLPNFRDLVRGLFQPVLSLSFNLGGLAAGALIAANLKVLSSTPWALVVYPGILSVRGSIGGLFCGRMSTSLHLGTIKPSILNNTQEAGILFHSVITLTFISSVVMGLIASLFSVFLMVATVSDTFTVLLVIIATMGISILLISPITFGVSVLSYRRGLDPDVIVYPIISTVADVIVTVCYLAVLGGSSSSQIWYSTLLVDLIFLSIVCYLISVNIHDRRFTGTIREFMLTLILVSLTLNFAGSFLNKISNRIGNRPEIYAVYPALIDTMGDVGSIVGSKATTRMALGSLAPSLSSVKRLRSEIGSAWCASLMMFALYSFISSSLYGFGNLKILFLQLTATNLLTTPLIIVISLTIAILTRRRGLDPDNFLIPIETSLADGITSLTLLLVLSWRLI
jgi:mgtE-like transporter